MPLLQPGIGPSDAMSLLQTQVFPSWWSHASEKERSNPVGAVVVIGSASFELVPKSWLTLQDRWHHYTRICAAPSCSLPFSSGLAMRFILANKWRSDVQGRSFRSQPVICHDHLPCLCLYEWQCHIETKAAPLAWDLELRQGGAEMQLWCLLSSFPGQLLPNSNDSTWMALPIETFPGQQGSVCCHFYELPQLPRLSDRQTPMLLCWVNASVSFKLNPLKIDTGCYIYVPIIQYNGIPILIEWTAKFGGSDRSGCKSQSHCLLAEGLWTNYLSPLGFSVFIFRTGLIIKPSVNS